MRTGRTDFRACSSAYAASTAGSAKRSVSRFMRKASSLMIDRPGRTVFRRIAPGGTPHHRAMGKPIAPSAPFSGPMARLAPERMRSSDRRYQGASGAGGGDLLANSTHVDKHQICSGATDRFGSFPVFHGRMAASGRGCVKTLDPARHNTILRSLYSAADQLGAVEADMATFERQKNRASAFLHSLGQKRSVDSKDRCATAGSVANSY